MKKKSEKVTQGKELKLELATVSTVILSTFQGITVEQDSKLRRGVEAAGGKYQVVKNHGGGARRWKGRRPGIAQGPERHELDRLHQDRSGSAREDSDESREGCSGISVPRGLGGRARHLDSGNQAAGGFAEQGRADQQDHVHAECSGAARGTVMAAVPRNLAVVTSEAVKANKFGGSAAAAPAAAPAPEPAQA